MDPNEQLTQYKLDAINTATPEQLTLMLYRAALANVETCRQHLRENPRDGLGSSQLSRDILSALADDVNVAHPHGKTMRDLYLYCWRTLLSAATSGNPDELAAVEQILKNLIQGLEAYRNADRASEPVAAEALSINFAG